MEKIKCPVCGQPVTQDELTHNDNMCTNCFREKIVAIRKAASRTGLAQKHSI